MAAIKAPGPAARQQAWLSPGSVRDKSGDVVHVDYTGWTRVADLKNDQWYFRTYKDQTIRLVDLHKALAAAGDKVRLIPTSSEQTIIDASTAFK